MLTEEYRPQTFKEIKGQRLPKKVLKSIVENPEDAPRSIILYGKFGSGKSSLAQIFAKAMNCKTKKIEPCLSCSICQGFNNNPYYYREIDTALAGSKSDLQQIVESMNYSLGKNIWRIYNFEEIQVASRQAQSTLLKELEKLSDRTFVLFFTTEIEKILDTIRSRSLELEFEKIDEKDIIANLEKICDNENKEIDEKLLELIAQRANGSLRDAQMLLDELFLIGEEEFQKEICDSKKHFLVFIKASLENDKEKAVKTLNKLRNLSMEELEKGFYKAIYELSEVWVGFKSRDNGIINEIIDLIGKEVITLIKISREEWLLNSFRSDLTFASGMMGFYQIVSELDKN